MIDPVGWLTAAAAAIALLIGGQPTGWGFQAGAVITDQGVTLGVTPVVIMDLYLYPPHFDAITLGGTVIVTAPGKPPGWQRWVDHYELGHVDGWQRFGLAYPRAVLEHPCAYDPAAPLVNHCSPWYMRQPWTAPIPPPPTHYALHVTIPPSSWPAASTAAAPWHK